MAIYPRQSTWTISCVPFFHDLTLQVAGWLEQPLRECLMIRNGSLFAINVTLSMTDCMSIPIPIFHHFRFMTVIFSRFAIPATSKRSIHFRSFLSGEDCLRFLYNEMASSFQFEFNSVLTRLRRVSTFCSLSGTLNL